MALFTLGKIAALLLGIQHLAQHDHDPGLPPPGPARPDQPRVVWIIFDETDQRLAFDQRPANVSLPEFDRFRTESLYATNALPPAPNTLLSMPQLISGQPLTFVEVSSHSDLRVKLANDGSFTTWSRLPSVFAGARQLGFNTALLGWFHPYDRILGRDLNYCEWFPHQQFESVRAVGFSTALVHEMASLSGAVYGRHVFADLCQASQAESLSLITNGLYGLTLLHLPPPHRPGVYLPDQDRFTILGMPKVAGYFNNLALADRWLGKLRQALEASGQADHTWLLLSADHSWRDAALYDGRYDPRVPFLLKPPGSREPLCYGPRFNTILTHDLLLAILRGEIKNRDSAQAWLDTHRQPPPT
jgi:hypothetical protein